MEMKLEFVVRKKGRTGEEAEIERMAEVVPEWTEYKKKDECQATGGEYKTK